MSSFKATFKVDGKSFDVVSCSYSFTQNIDERGRPASDVRKGHIKVTVVASDDDKVLGWMIDPYKKTNGSITLEKIDQASTLKEIKFEDGYCVSYEEDFDAVNAQAMTDTFEISARKITVGSATHEDKW
jgi:hypothetical protein